VTQPVSTAFIVIRQLLLLLLRLPLAPGLVLSLASSVVSTAIVASMLT
jgi:hypothetical protein